MTTGPATPVTPAAGPSTPRPVLGMGKTRNQQKYGTPLPILLPSSPLFTKPAKTLLATYTPSLLSGPRIQIPQCVGRYDATTRSVWVTDKGEMAILFQRGFFGKGTLSRSEPTWRDRRITDLKSGSGLTAEQVREQRRIERKQFKIDRAAAMLHAAKTAEAVLTAGAQPSPAATAVDTGDADETASVTTTGEGVDLASLTPQTYLVRPTRPDSNRNRGRNAFKRRPKPPQVPAAATPSSASPAPPPADLGPDESREEEDEVDYEAMVEETEHLQLSLEEAWFLSSALGVLRIYDPASDTYLVPSTVLPRFLTPYPECPAPVLRPDDPFVVSYVAYHHFRALGWVVKPGIKFACDWLLYKKGPVFSHSAFSCVVIPVYSDPNEQAVSPYGQEDWYVERCSWKWMNTVMRVNSLVQKARICSRCCPRVNVQTVILVYVTIPAVQAFPSRARLPDGGLDWRKVDMRDLLSRYTVRETALTRFSPARRRD